MAYTDATIAAPTSPQNFIPTNRVHSEFFLHGGPRLPVDEGGDSGMVYVRYSDTVLYTLKRTPSFEGQLYWSTAEPDGLGGYTISLTGASLYIAVKEAQSDSASNIYYKLVWKPVMRTAAIEYLDPTTGKTWDPVGLYTCNPPHLCPG